MKKETETKSDLFLQDSEPSSTFIEVIQYSDCPIYKIINSRLLVKHLILHHPFICITSSVHFRDYEIIFHNLYTY